MSKQIRKFTKKNKVNQRKRERQTLRTIEEMDEIIIVPPMAQQHFIYVLLYPCNKSYFYFSYSVCCHS